MKEKYLINARIIDPKNQIDEIGGLIIDSKGLIKAVGKKVTNGNLPSAREYYEYFGLTPDKMAMAKKNALIMHPGPMNRGVEIDTTLADDINRSVIREQVELGVAVRMACLKIYCKKT